MILFRKRKRRKKVVDVVVDVAGESHNGRQRRLKELYEFQRNKIPVDFSHYKYKGEPAIKVLFYDDDVGVIPANCVNIVSKIIDISEECFGSIEYFPHDYDSGGFYSAEISFRFINEPQEVNTYEESVHITLTGIAKNQEQLKIIHQLPMSVRLLRFSEDKIDGKNVYNVYLFEDLLLGKISKKNYELIIKETNENGIVELLTKVNSTGANYSERYSASLLLHKNSL